MRVVFAGKGGRRSRPRKARHGSLRAARIEATGGAGPGSPGSGRPCGYREL